MLDYTLTMITRVTGSTIEKSLLASPGREWALFTNREKYDLIAMYDSSSEAFGPSNSPLSLLVHAIYETASEKILKKMPVLLVGGLDAWNRELGKAEMACGAARGVGLSW
jgi:ubiquitin carboxyl-terminal hydrolase 8